MKKQLNKKLGTKLVRIPSKWHKIMKIKSGEKSMSMSRLIVKALKEYYPDNKETK